LATLDVPPAHVVEHIFPPTVNIARLSELFLIQRMIHYITLVHPDTEIHQPLQLSTEDVDSNTDKVPITDGNCTPVLDAPNNLLEVATEQPKANIKSNIPLQH
jgi:hypothetical protein